LTALDEPLARCAQDRIDAFATRGARLLILSRCGGGSSSLIRGMTIAHCSSMHRLLAMIVISLLGGCADRDKSDTSAIASQTACEGDCDSTQAHCSGGCTDELCRSDCSVTLTRCRAACEGPNDAGLGDASHSSGSDAALIPIDAASGDLSIDASAFGGAGGFGAVGDAAADGGGSGSSGRAADGGESIAGREEIGGVGGINSPTSGAGGVLEPIAGRTLTGGIGVLSAGHRGPVGGEVF
jgi:hypothetical protein